jgi:hypothetical protein
MPTGRFQGLQAEFVAGTRAHTHTLEDERRRSKQKCVRRNRCQLAVRVSPSEPPEPHGSRRLSVGSPSDRHNEQSQALLHDSPCSVMKFIVPMMTLATLFFLRPRSRGEICRLDKRNELPLLSTSDVLTWIGLHIQESSHESRRDCGCPFP